jgi:acetyltransferase-like isoleucine patch superfamily enzyme
MNHPLRSLVRLFRGQRLPEGIRIGRGVHLGEPCWLDFSHGRHITIEDQATLAPGVRILCHDAASFRRVGKTWVAPVTIGAGAFVGAESLIMPGVTIGAGAVVAAGAVVTQSVAPGMVVAGVPAREIMTVADLDRKRNERKAKSFPSAVYEVSHLAAHLDAELRQAVEQDGGYFLT